MKNEQKNSVIVCEPVPQTYNTLGTMIRVLTKYNHYDYVKSELLRHYIQQGYVVALVD